MRAGRLRRLRVAAVLAMTAVLGAIAFGPSTSAQAGTYTPINGAGSTYAYPALEQWATNLEPQGLSINYTANGSADGREEYIAHQLDYAGSDIAFLLNGDADPFGGVDTGSLSFAYSYIPDVAGGLSFLYNLQVDGHRITNMRLSGPTIAKIFTGKITNWDNPAITHDYGQQLPSIPITVVTRSDGAGESYFLSNWMLDEYPSLWIPFCESQGGGSLCTKDPTEYYPNHLAGFKALDGANDVAGYVESSVNNGAIGYAEYAYALDDNVPVVSMLNAAGYYVQPTASNVAIALEAARINQDQNSVDFLMQTLNNVYTDKDPRAYPLSSYSYLIVPRTSRTISGHTYGPEPDFNTAKGRTLSTYVNYILCGAQQTSAQLGYSPLPEEMVTGGFVQDKYIPGAVTSPASRNYAGCNNPAYLNGKDVLTATAPYPSPCQKAGEPLDCVVVVINGKPTPSRGSGTGGPGSPSGNSPGSGGGTKTGTGGAKTGPGSSAGQNTAGASPGSSEKINPNTGQVESGSPSSASADVYAQQVGLASQPAEQWLFGGLTALELIGVVAVPASLGTWLTRRRRRGGPPGPGGPGGPSGPPSGGER